MSWLCLLADTACQPGHGWSTDTALAGGDGAGALAEQNAPATLALEERKLGAVGPRKASSLKYCNVRMNSAQQIASAYKNTAQPRTYLAFWSPGYIRVQHQDLVQAEVAVLLLEHGAVFILRCK